MPVLDCGWIEVIQREYICSKSLCSALFLIKQQVSASRSTFSVRLNNLPIYIALMDQTFDDHSAPSSATFSPATTLQRGKACMSCRRRKLVRSHLLPRSICYHSYLLTEMRWRTSCLSSMQPRWHTRRLSVHHWAEPL